MVRVASSAIIDHSIDSAAFGVYVEIFYRRTAFERKTALSVHSRGRNEDEVGKSVVVSRRYRLTRSWWGSEVSQTRAHHPATHKVSHNKNPRCSSPESINSP